jgi:uncharacterized protein (DUF697 family)
MSEAGNRQAEALRIIKSKVGWATGAGLVPFPLLDLAAITAVQVRMVHQLAGVYGVPFRVDAVKRIIGVVVGSGGAVLVAAPVASMLKAFPVLGTFLSTFVEPAAAAASTYALGHVFMQHFESGGTLLNLEPDAMRQHYYEEYRKGHAQPTAAQETETAAAA